MGSTQLAKHELVALLVASAARAGLEVMIQFILLVLVIFPPVAASRSATGRAHQKLPSPAYTAPRHAVNTMLNHHLLQTQRDVELTPCERWNIAELQAAQKTIFKIRDPTLQTIYVAANDSRALAVAGVPVHSLTELEGAWRNEELWRYDARTTIAAMCAKTIMWWTHHVPAERQVEMAASTKWRLPLLSPTQVDVGNATELLHDTSCNACHSTDNPPQRPGGPHASVGNFNLTMLMYDGIPGGVGGHTLKTADYRYDSKQLLYVAQTATDARARDCVVLFDEDESVWEWYSDGKCAKVMENRPMMTPNWPTHAGMVDFAGNVTFIDPRNNQTNKTCTRYCAPSNGPCFCETLAALWEPVRHTHVTHSAADGGVTFYSDFRATPELHGEKIKKPAFCPPQNTKAKFSGNTLAGLEKVCLKCWYPSPYNTRAPCMMVA